MAILTRFIFWDIIVLILTLIVAIYANFQWKYQTWKKKKIPYLEPSFPYGNLQPMHKPVHQSIDLFNIIEKGRKNGWNYFGIFLTSKPLFVPLDLELIKCILTRDFNSFTDKGIYFNEKDDPLSANLFTVGGKKWKNLRTTFTPTFTSGKMREMFQILLDANKGLNEFLSAHDTTVPINVKHVFACYTTNVIGSCAFGLEYNTFTDPNSPFIQNGLNVLKLDTSKVITRLVATAFPTISKLLRLKTMPSEATKFYYDLVTETINYREKNNYYRNDFLQLLINIRKDGKKLTMEEIVAQCFAFFLAGFETSATTMTFALYELARNPDVQERVREEIFDVFKQYDDKITYNSLKDLEYMQQVLDETLRLYAPLPFTLRKCVEDYKIPDSDIILDKGTEVIIPIRNIHYSEVYYDNPEEFNPENFSPETKRQRHQYAHLPFGEGPRNCIGMRFGIMQSKVGLATVLKKFRVRLSSQMKLPLEIDPKSLLVPNIKGGMWLTLEAI